MKQLIKREEQRLEDTWELEAIYTDDEAWKADAQKMRILTENFEKQQGHLADSESRMLQILNEYCEARQLMGKLYVYANMRQNQDTANSFYQQMAGESQQLMTKLGSTSSWLEPELLNIEEKVLEQFFAKTKGLELYRIYIEEKIRRKAHVLTAEQEQLLAKVEELANAPSNIYSMFNNADVKFDSITGENGETLNVTQAAFISLEEHKDRRIRKDAFQSFYRSYERMGNTIAAIMDANVRQAGFYAKERHYASTLEAALDDSQIPTAVYHQLIAAVEARLPVMHQYVELRKELLGVEELHMYDVYVPMTADVSREYSFEEAKTIVLEGLRPLGEDYIQLLQEGFDQRWIDVYPNEGKRTGAYSWGSYDTKPYVMMNFQGNLNHVFTLAHEMGHSLHSWYTRHHQPYVYGDYKIFVAEVASTCNEALLIRHLLSKTDEPGERKYLINYFLEQFKSTLFRQTMFAEFELEIHTEVEKGGTLTKERLCEIYYALNRKYFGPDMVSDPEIAYEWARIPHFYTPFYVYQYATGFAAAIAISDKIWRGEEHAVENYKKFLSGGSSMSPIELLKLCGVDMTGPEAVKDALDMFEEYIEQMRA
ncbi:MAG: oligoendopeptidase F [Lachnospiraceae bacterium]|nr:oligoendopeptidase F [Lachnospiraceae bacterium]MDD3796034.1 oligoendopeptidase F [Lachnospiraceae bacterium]